VQKIVQQPELKL